MPGYSGTPLPRKLGIKDQFRIALFEVPKDVGTELEDWFAKCEISDSRLDFAMIFVKSRTDLEKQFSRFAKRLAPTGMLWASWPRKAPEWLRI